MSKLITFKKTALYSLMTAAMTAASQGAFAHTRLETPTVPEATRVHNQVVIGHGCPPSTDRGSTMGTSVVFPNAVSYTPIIGIDSGNGKEFTDKPASDFYSPQSGIGAMIRGGSPWHYGNNKVDAKGNKDGFWAGGEAFDQKMATPINIGFYSAAVTINSDSCARSVTFELAIADFCNISVPGATVKDEEALFWSPIPNFSGVPGQPFGVPTGRAEVIGTPTVHAVSPVPAGPAYSNYDGYQDAAHTIAGDGWGSPATLKVNRNLTTNPLPSSCGDGVDVYVYPSAEQINKELPIWSENNQTGTPYWQ